MQLHKSLLVHLNPGAPNIEMALGGHSKCHAETVIIANLTSSNACATGAEDDKMACLGFETADERPPRVRHLRLSACALGIFCPSRLSCERENDRICIEQKATSLGIENSVRNGVREVAMLEEDCRPTGQSCQRAGKC